MAQKYVQTLLLLLACIAHAQAPDFDIYQDGVKLTGSPLSAEVDYGKAYTFSVRMEGGGENAYQWSWCGEGQTLCNEGQSYSFSASENISDILTIKVKAEKGADSREKTFNLKIASTYVISFNSGGGTPAPQQQVVQENEKAGKPPVDPAKAGYKFVHWYEGASSSSSYDFDLPIKSSITLTARWDLIRYPITYEPNDESEPWEETYTVEYPLVSMFPIPDDCNRKFEGWFDNKNLSGLPIDNFIPNPSSLGPKTFYAKWTDKGKQTPSAELLIYSLPQGPFQYDGKERSLDVEKRKNDCEVGNIKVLYNNSPEEPKEVGEYNLSVSFDSTKHYKADTISLQGKIIIEKYKLTGSFAFEFVVKDKDYDGTKKATVENPRFLGSFPSFCVPEEGKDYSIAAEFDTSIVGAIPVTAEFKWQQNAPVFNNCDLLSINVDYDSNKTANINKATVKFEIIVPEYYRLLSPGTFRPNVATDDFVDKDSITWEYKKESETEYSQNLPDSLGPWRIRATLKGTDNYKEAKDSADFTVIRGSGEAVSHSIKFEKAGFKNDTTLSKKNKAYFVAGSENCRIDSAVVHIEVSEPDMSLKKDGIPPGRYCEESDFCEEECVGSEDCYMRYRIPIVFGKPGLDTIVYTLSSIDGISEPEQDTLLIETPVPFDSVVQQRWNNAFFVNNNPKTNGGYSFTDFAWFKNDAKAGSLQFYSAGPKSTDVLRTSDIYRVQMHYLKGNEEFRISTCDGSPKTASAPERSEAAVKKRVLGLGGASASAGAKIYNSKGERASGNAPGVYLVEEK